MKNLKTPAKALAPKKAKPKAKVRAKAAVAPIVEEQKIVEEICGCGCENNNNHFFGKLFFGLVLVLVGLFYLGKNLGVLPDINMDFRIVWPVVLILAGLFLVNRRSRISIIVGVFSALVFMLILSFIVTFNQIQIESDSEAVMPILPSVEKAENIVSTSSAVLSEDVKLDNFTNNEVVSSPLTISGSAKGAWFFEASFPVRVLDEAGKELGVGIAQAQSSSLTEDFVPFKATVVFTRPTSSIGSLVLENDNPSGLPENSQKVILPIKF